MDAEQQDELRRAWEYHKTADELLAQRMSYGMVAQSMLLVSYVTLSAANQRNTPWLTIIELIIAAFGFWYTAVQNRSMAFLIGRLDFLKQKYLVKDPVYRDYLEAIPESPCGKILRQRYLPRALYLVWFSLLILCIWR